MEPCHALLSLTCFKVNHPLGFDRRWWFVGVVETNLGRIRCAHVKGTTLQTSQPEIVKVAVCNSRIEKNKGNIVNRFVWSKHLIASQGTRFSYYPGT